MLSDFAKEKVFWTRKMNLKLVKFIQSRPNIWNPKHPKYNFVAYRDRTYAEFASKYGNEFTWQAVKDRWTNIRCTFANYLRKLNASRAKGDSEEYKVNWHLWNPCKFLLKVKKKRIKAINANENYSQENGNNDQHDMGETESVEENESFPSLTCDNIMQNILTVFQNIHNDAIDIQNSKYSEIGQMVARKLSEMTPHDASKMVHKITEIFLLNDENNLSNGNDIKAENL